MDFRDVAVGADHFDFPHGFPVLFLEFGFHDRGLLREGMAADIAVFDPETVGARMPEVVTDLPAGAKRLLQKCDGMAATIVNGQVLLRDNEPTGNLPGKLIRRGLRH